ncbi:DUF2188 domain-containing protein [Streptomyces sp. NBC_00090]|uniref:DUF2188 domain-containing protein n=1 Tax=Streptomyces sp. NBC_00090 TaxID=2903619 RepID=UPI003245B208
MSVDSVDEPKTTDHYTGALQESGNGSPPGGKEKIMAAKRTVYHVAPSSERAAAAGVKWQVAGREGRRLLHEPHRTQKDAIASAREHAKEHTPAQVVVHARDGHIRTAYTYGDAPAASPDERGRKAEERGGLF